MMAVLLNPRFLIAVALAILLSTTHLFAYRAGKANVRADFDSYKTEQAQLTQAAEKQARDREQALQQQANQTEEAKNEQIRIIGDQLDTALASLSKRPDRPAGNVPKTSSACKGATGASLSAQDARFSLGEAARADRLRTALKACYEQYDSLTIK